MKYNVMGMSCAAVDAHGSANAGGRHGCLQKKSAVERSSL